MRKGFMLVELLVVAGIIVLLLAIVLTAFWGRRDHEILASSTVQALSIFEEARMKTVASENFSRHGVHVEEGRLVSFRGDSYSSTSPYNEIHELNDRVRITTVDIAGGTNVVFEKLSGTTTNPGTFKIALTRGEASTTIRIHASGIVETE